MEYVTLDQAMAESQALQQEAKQRLLAVIGAGYGADLERIVDCIIRASVLNAAALAVINMPREQANG